MEAAGLGCGGNLFPVSDTLVLLRAVGTGGRPVDTAVMGNYLAAQLLIVDGLMRRG